MPPLSVVLETLSGSSWFSTLDFRQGFLQVDIREQDREKITFYSTQGLIQNRGSACATHRPPTSLSWT